MGKKKNAFVMFFEHYMRMQMESGRRISKKIAIEECAPKWSQLSDEEKRVYSDMAVIHRSENQKIKGQTKGDAESRLVDDLKYLTAAIDSAEALKNHKFYIIHTNYYCKTAESLYVPAELAIAEFTLKAGITRTYHSLIDPGEIPLGYAYDAKRNSEEVHGLPLPPYEDSDTNFEEILESIFQFMEINNSEDGLCVPFFTVERNVNPTTNVLQNLVNFKFGEKVKLFTVFPLHKMFFWVKNKCSEYCQPQESGFPVLSNAWTELERDVFRYCTGISCDFHNNCPEKYHNCSLSVVQRLVYVICDHCCRYLKIELIRGKHVPLNFVKDKQKEKIAVKKEFSAIYSNALAADDLEKDSHAGSSSDDPVPTAWISGSHKKVKNIKEEPNEEKGDQQQDCEDDDFSSEDELFMAIGRGRILYDKLRAVGAQRSKPRLC